MDWGTVAHRIQSLVHFCSEVSGCHIFQFKKLLYKVKVNCEVIPVPN